MINIDQIFSILEALKTQTETIETEHIAEIITSLKEEYRKHPMSSSKTDKDGNSILHLAAELGNPKLIEFLIKECRMNPNQFNHKGETPLHALFRWSRKMHETGSLGGYSNSLKPGAAKILCDILMLFLVNGGNPFIKQNNKGKESPWELFYGNAGIKKDDEAWLNFSGTLKQFPSYIALNLNSLPLEMLIQFLINFKQHKPSVGLLGNFGSYQSASSNELQTTLLFQDKDQNTLLHHLMLQIYFLVNQGEVKNIIENQTIFKALKFIRDEFPNEFVKIMSASNLYNQTPLSLYWDAYGEKSLEELFSLFPDQRSQELLKSMIRQHKKPSLIEMAIQKNAKKEFILSLVSLDADLNRAIQLSLEKGLDLKVAQDRQWILRLAELGANSYSAIQKAIQTKDYAFIRELLACTKGKANLAYSEGSKQGNSLLHHCLVIYDLELLKLVLDELAKLELKEVYGALNFPNRRQQTVLQLAWKKIQKTTTIHPNDLNHLIVDPLFQQLLNFRNNITEALVKQLSVNNGEVNLSIFKPLERLPGVHIPILRKSEINDTHSANGTNGSIGSTGANNKDNSTSTLQCMIFYPLYNKNDNHIAAYLLVDKNLLHSFLIVDLANHSRFSPVPEQTLGKVLPNILDRLHLFNHSLNLIGIVETVTILSHDSNTSSLTSTAGFSISLTKLFERHSQDVPALWSPSDLGKIDEAQLISLIQNLIQSTGKPAESKQNELTRNWESIMRRHLEIRQKKLLQQEILCREITSERHHYQCPDNVLQQAMGCEYAHGEYLYHYLAYLPLNEGFKIPVHTASVYCPYNQGSFIDHRVYTLVKEKGLVAVALVPIQPSSHPPHPSQPSHSSAHSGNSITATIPDIKILFRGTDSLESVIRDLETGTAGQRSLRFKLHTIISQLEHIASVNFKHSNYSITAGGHSLGGADGQNFMQGLMSYLAENIKQGKSNRITGIRLQTYNSAGVSERAANNCRVLAKTLSDNKIKMECMHQRVIGDPVQFTGQADLFCQVPKEHAKVSVLKFIDYPALDSKEVASMLENSNRLGSSLQYVAGLGMASVTSNPILYYAGKEVAANAGQKIVSLVVGKSVEAALKALMSQLEAHHEMLRHPLAVHRDFQFRDKVEFHFGKGKQEFCTNDNGSDLIIKAMGPKLSLGKFPILAKLQALAFKTISQGAKIQHAIQSSNPR